jgi:hypothetical protein
MNPFPYPARFSVSFSSEGDEAVFKFLGRRKVFTLSQYNEEFQIPFAFTPTALGQFQAHVIVASLGPARSALPDLESLPTIRWVYPIIGNSIAAHVTEAKQLKCRAHEPLLSKVTFTLVGETEIFQVSQYSLSFAIPPACEFIRPSLEITGQELRRDDQSTELDLTISFSPKRPLSQTIKLIVQNPLRQEWQFKLELNVELGKVHDSVMIDSLLSKTGMGRVQLPVLFPTQTPFHAYFVSGSASEFSVKPSHGMIEPSLIASTELPFDVLFAPKMYGKVLKGLMVVDTLDAQYLFDVFGKTPEYVPPVVTKAPLQGDLIPLTGSASDLKKRRNVVRENIESIKAKAIRSKSVARPVLPPLG